MRPPWRLLIFLLLVVIAGAGNRIVLAGARPFARANGSNSWTAAAITWYIVVVIVLVHAAMLRWVDRRPWSAVFLDRAAARGQLLLFGWLLGAIPIAAVSLLLMALSWLRIVPALPGSWAEAALRMSVLLLAAALLEELLSRGYIFATLREWLGAPVAIGITSLLFGLLHLANPGATALSAALVTIGGVYLAVILVVTRSMYASWMAHWAWNWVMAVLLHVQVSGIFIPRPDYKTIETGPDWITGGSWGPEGSVLAGVADLIIIGLLFRQWKSRKPELATG